MCVCIHVLNWPHACMIQATCTGMGWSHIAIHVILQWAGRTYSRKANHITSDWGVQGEFITTSAGCISEVL